jgi:ATP adenylyltransferase
MSYVTGVSARTSGGCVFCEALSGANDRESLLLARGTDAFLILNRYPYAAGHLMAVVNRHVGTLPEATPTELAGAMELVSVAVRILSAEYRPDGFNVGLNQGRIAGAGIVDHLHVHVVPRWSGDNNFMAVVGDTRVLPEDLETTYDRLKGRLGD